MGELGSRSRGWAAAVAPGWGGGDSDSGGDGGDDGGGPCTKYSRPDLWKRTDGDSRGLGPMMVEAASMESAPCWVTGAEGSNPALARGTAGGGVISGESGGWRGEGGVVGGGEGVGEGGGRGSRFQGGGLAKSSSESVALMVEVWWEVRAAGGVGARAVGVGAWAAMARRLSEGALGSSLRTPSTAAWRRATSSVVPSSIEVDCEAMRGRWTTFDSSSFSTLSRVQSMRASWRRMNLAASKWGRGRPEVGMRAWRRAVHAAVGWMGALVGVARRRALTWTRAVQAGSPHGVRRLLRRVTLAAVAFDLPVPMPGSQAWRVGWGPRTFWRGRRRWEGGGPWGMISSMRWRV